MANEIDKFVLQYQVELRDSITRLNELQEKLMKVNKTGKDSGKGIVDALKEISPTIGKTIDFAGKLTQKFGPLIVTFTVLAGAIKLADGAMREFNERQKLAYQTGVGTIGITNFERNMRSASGGQVGRDAARGTLGTISNLTMSAYSDPTRQGEAARKLGMFGINPVGKGGGIASTEDVTAQMSQKMAQMTREQAVAMGQLIGLTAQQTDALRKLNGATAETTHMTDEEALRKQNATEASMQLQGAYTNLKENMKDAFDTIGEDLLPSVAALMEGIAKLSEYFFKGVRAVTDFGDHMGRFIDAIASHWKDLLLGRKSLSQIIDESEKQAKPPKAKQTQDKEQASYKQIHQNLAQETLNMNTFSAAVNKFSGTVDVQRAWAAWAGGVGRAAGLPGASNTTALQPGEIRTDGATFNASAQAGALGGGAPPTGAPAPATGAAAPAMPAGAPVAGGAPSTKTMAALNQYDAIIKEASNKTGVPENIIRGVIMTESSGINKRSSGVGAQGLMQIMPLNFKSLGITDAMDPRQNIMGGATLLQQMIKRAGGNVELGLRYYNGGFDRSKWGKQNAAYAGKVFGFAGANAPATAAGTGGSGYVPAPRADAFNAAAVPTFGFAGQQFQFGKGESPEKVQYNLVKQALAGKLGDIGQLNRGQYTKGDVAWAGSQQMSELVNSRTSLIQSLKNPALMQRDKEGYANQLKDVDAQIASLQNFMPTILGKAREGQRNVTLGDTRIIVNAGAITDPKELARQIRKEMQSTLTEILNEHGSSNNA